MEKRKLTKIITIATIITSIATAISVGAKFVIPLYLAYKFSIESNITNSIGIIGGADGPTVIYCGIQPDTSLIAMVFGLLSIAGIIYLIFNKKVTK